MEKLEIVNRGKMGSVDVEGMGRAIRSVFDECQDGSVAMSKSINKFCKILNKVSAYLYYFRFTVDTSCRLSDFLSHEN